MKHAGFIVEFNNPTKYSHDLKIHLNELDVRARRLAHKTGWWIGYGEEIYKFRELRLAIAKSISKSNGSALLISMETGNGWVIRWRNSESFYRVKIKKGNE